MKLNVNIDEDEMVTEIHAMISAITDEYLPVMIFGAVIFVVVLILTSFCGSALAIYCCKKGRFRRVKRLRRSFFEPFKIPRNLRRTRCKHEEDVKVAL